MLQRVVDAMICAAKAEQASEGAACNGLPMRVNNIPDNSYLFLCYSFFAMVVEGGGGGCDEGGARSHKKELLSLRLQLCDFARTVYIIYSQVGLVKT